MSRWFGEARAQAEKAALAGAMALPERAQRILAGRPVVRDGQVLATETQLMLRMQRIARLPGAETMPIPQGREAVLHHAQVAGGRQPVGSVRDLRAGDRAARLYTPSSLSSPSSPSSPKSTAPVETSPLLVFFHGGGFMYGDLESHDAPCRYLAERSGVLVLSVDYPLGPEHRFPAAHDHAFAAYRWVLDHADELGADPEWIGLGGDSAGGNLAATTAIRAARGDLPVAFQLLVYPAVDGARETASSEMFADGFYLTTALMDLANRTYLAPGDDPRTPGFSPLFDEVPADLAPAYIATAGFDPLRDEGEAYARKLSEAGVEVELERFPDQIHGFLNIVGVGRTAPAANARIAAVLRAGLKAGLKAGPG